MVVLARRPEIDPPSGRGLGYVPNFEILGPPQYLCIGCSYTPQIWCARGSWVVLARRPQIGPQVGVAWGTCPISKFWDPLNISLSDEATLFKFGVHVDPGLFLPADQKLAPKWAWPGVRAQFRNFGTPSISVYRMKLHSSNLVCTWILGCSCPQTRNWPPSGRGLGYVPNFEISGPPQYLCIG